MYSGNFAPVIHLNTPWIVTAKKQRPQLKELKFINIKQAILALQVNPRQNNGGLGAMKSFPMCF